MPAVHLKTKLFTIGDTTLLRLPDDISAELPSRSQVMIKGALNGYEFQTALEPDGNWSHWLEINEEMRNATGVKSGDTVTLDFEVTKDWIEPTIPDDLQKALDADPEVFALWSRVTPMARWEWIRWIVSTLNPETRKKRIDVSFSKLRAGERRPCCFNRAMCTNPHLSKGGRLLDPTRIEN